MRSWHVHAFPQLLLPPPPPRSSFLSVVLFFVVVWVFLLRTVAHYGLSTWGWKFTEYKKIFKFAYWGMGENTPVEQTWLLDELDVPDAAADLDKGTKSSTFGLGNLVRSPYTLCRPTSSAYVRGRLATIIPNFNSTGRQYSSRCCRRLFCGLHSWRLVSHDSLPPWLRDNSFILGYLNSVSLSLLRDTHRQIHITLRF